MNKLRVEGVPIWATIYLLVVIGFGVVLGIPALLGEGFADLQTIGWGGRELGVAIGAILALLYRSALAYFLIFVIGTFRELSDLLEALDETPSNTSSAAMVGVFLIVGIACAAVSYRGIKSEQRSQPEAR